MKAVLVAVHRLAFGRAVGGCREPDERRHDGGVVDRVQVGDAPAINRL